MKKYRNQKGDVSPTEGYKTYQKHKTRGLGFETNALRRTLVEF